MLLKRSEQLRVLRAELAEVSSPADRAGLLEGFASQAYLTGDGSAAMAALDEALMIRRASRDLAGQGRVLSLQAESELAHGRLAIASALASSALRVIPDRSGQLRVIALTVLARARARRGETGAWASLDEAAEIVRSMIEPPPLPKAAAARAKVAAARPNVAAARAKVAAARAEVAWLERAPAEKIRAETDGACTGEQGAGQQDTGQQGAGQQGAGHQDGGHQGERCWLAAEVACWRWRAGLDLEKSDWLAEPYRREVTGDHAGAARWWRDRHCEYEAALALASSADPGLLREALEVFGRLGTRPAAVIVAARLRALGERVPRGPRAETAANPAGLTRREGEVLAMLSDGLSNTEIAASLVLSVRTIDHHVAAIFRKLGTHSRAEARAAAVRIGLIGLVSR